MKKVNYNRCSDRSLLPFESKLLQSLTKVIDHLQSLSPTPYQAYMTVRSNHQIRILPQPSS